MLLPAADDAERGLRARVDRIERRLDMTSPAGDRPARPAPAAAAPAAPSRRPHLRRRRAAPAEAAAPAGAPAHETPVSPAAQTEPVRPVEPAPMPVAAAGAAVPSTSPAASEAVPEMGPGAGGTESIRRMWPDVMGRLGGIKRTTWSLVSHYAQVLDYDGTRLLLQFDSPGRAALFGKGAHQEFLRQALIDIMGIDCRFEATAGDAPAPPPAAGASAAAQPPAGATSGPSAPAPSSQPSPRPAATSAPAPESRPAATRPAPAESRDDIPLPPEPPPDDQPPEPEGGVRRRPAAAGSSSPGAARAASVTLPAAAPAPRVVRLADDVPSVDDPDVEGSNLVGASVVEQLLGGRVIEDRQD